MQIFTIGFAGRTAEDFFGTLRVAGVRRLVDIRRHNTSQLAGYTKRRDLPWLLAELCDADYTHRLDLAPTGDLITAYRKEGLGWDAFAGRYRAQLEGLDAAVLAGDLAALPTVLLCSEADAAACHRGLLADLLRAATPKLRVTHL